MESKLRRESHSIIEKVFNKHEQSGSIGREDVPTLLKELEVETPSFEEVEDVTRNNALKDGRVDWGGFNKIAMHFLLKQAKTDADQFIHKHEVNPTDFPGEKTASEKVAE